MKSGLWQISTVGGSPRKLSDEGRDAEVSPDGSQIVFLKGAEKSQELWLMGSDGQQPRKIAGDLGDLFRSRFGRVTECISRFCVASTARGSMGAAD
jgi:Tol biopolymer transport system component